MAANKCAPPYPLQVTVEAVEGNVDQENRKANRKANRFCQLSLLKGNTAPKSRLQSERPAGSDAVADETFELLMSRYDPAFNSAARSSALKTRSAKLRKGKTELFPAPGGPATMNISGGSIYPPKSRSEPSRMSDGSSSVRRFPSASTSPFA
jgi:hypothetical protein